MAVANRRPGTGEVVFHSDRGSAGRSARLSGDGAVSDGTALVDLVLDRNPFMLANGPRRVARPHALMLIHDHQQVRVRQIHTFAAGRGLELARPDRLAAVRRPSP